MIKKINKNLLNFVEETPYITRYYILPKKMSTVLSVLKGYPQSHIFLNKVTKKEAPNYHLIIKEPMDLGTVQKKIGTYNTYKEFKRDLDLIWDNCIKYNAGPYFIRCANIMRRAVENAEITRSAVEMRYNVYDSEIVKGLRVCSGVEIRYIICRMLKQEGIESISKHALDILEDVTKKKIMDFIHKVIVV